MKLFYECNFFEDDFQETSEFKISQNELILAHEITSNKHSFAKNVVEYECRWTKQKNFDPLKATIVLPIRDNLELLKVTLKNFEKNNLSQHCNIIIVDDRSDEPLEHLVLENQMSYLRVDNERGFNFSMLNNIAAKLCHSLGVATMILWNADLWCVKEEWFVEILSKHHDHSSCVSGAKLLYPPADLSLNKEDTVNIQKHFSHMAGKWRDTVQFGGSYWIPTPPPVSISPIHRRRFAPKDDCFVNQDNPESFVTGAFQIWNLHDFVSLGGFNPSLANVFQDVDICLRALESNKKIYYFGKDAYFYHDESAVHENVINHTKENDQYVSDHVLFGKLWNNKLQKMVL